MTFARRNKTEVEINLTPLIDVVFLLLIFFMVSTTFIRETHLSIDLPEAGSEEVSVAGDSIDVSITRSGNFAVNGELLGESTLSTLKQAMLQASDGNNTIPLIITADAATPHQSVVTAMDAAGQLGFVHLSIATTTETGG